MVRRRLGIALLFFSLAALLLVAQQQLMVTPPDTHGPFLGKPYTAHKIENVRKYLPDGTVTTRQWQVTEARNSQGVTASVSSTMVNNGGELSVAFQVHLVVDPVHRTVLEWTNLHRTGRMIQLPARDRFAAGKKIANPNPNAPKTQTEQLGQRVINGLQCTGTRTVTTTSGAVLGASSNIESTREVWADNNLGIVVSSTETNPRTGTTTYELTDLNQGPPDPALFQLPAGYDLNVIRAPGASFDQNAALATAGLDLAHLPPMSYADAMMKLSDPMNREVAAAVLVKMAATDDDPAQKDKIAYAVARADLQLVAAESLEQKVVTSAEQRVAAMPQTLPMPHRTAVAEHELARYWDTLGYILERQGISGLRYLAAAWELDPQAYYGHHLGRAYESRGNVPQALAVYRAALLAGGSPEMKQLIEDRIQAISGAGAPVTESGDQTYVVAAIRYAPSEAAPLIQFLSTDSVKMAVRKAAKAAATEWTAPDAGPEVVTRLVAVTCGHSEPCSTRGLPVQYKLPDSVPLIH